MKPPDEPFLRRVHAIALGAAALSLVVGVLYAVFEEDLDLVRSNRADSYSVSALGHAALFDLVESQGVPIVRSRFHSERKVDAGGVLLVAEPADAPLPAPRRLSRRDTHDSPDARETHDDAEQRDREQRREQLLSAPRLVLVLPRFRPALTDRDAALVESVDEVDRETVERCVRPLLSDATVVRLDHVPTWTTNALGVEPTLVAPQLLRSSQLAPLIASDEGILVGEATAAAAKPGQRALVVADPTLLENHGIWRGDNASLALSLLDTLRGDGGPVVVDETSHGFELVPSVYRELFRRPLLWTTLHLLAIAALGVWAASGRFGKPLPAALGMTEGKHVLLANAADLMELIGATPHALRRYLDATVGRMADALHVPTGLTPAQRVEALAARSSPTRAQKLRATAAAVREELLEGRRRPELVELAQRVHHLRTEIVDGT
jgi:hypothetical protein